MTPERAAGGNPQQSKEQILQQQNPDEQLNRIGIELGKQDLPGVNAEIKQSADSEERHWVTRTFLRNTFRIDRNILNRLLLPVSKMQGRDPGNNTRILFNKEQSEETLLANGYERREELNLPQVDKKSRHFIDQDGRQWIYLEFFINNYADSPNAFKKLLSQVPTIPGRDIHGRSTTFFDKTKAEEVLLAHGYKKKEVVENNKEIPDAEEGWMTSRSLARQLKKSSETLTRIANLYRKDNPKWFQECKVGGVIREVFSPELINEISKYVKQLQEAPVGWQTCRNLRIALDGLVFDGKIRKIANKYRSNHPEWFGVYLGTNKQEREYYSPQLIEGIIKELNTKDEPKDTTEADNFMEQIAFGGGLQI